MRTRALVGLGFAVAVGIVAWIWLSRATQSGIDRLAAIDRVRAECEAAWNTATTKAESLAVDRIALKDTIDARSNAALRKCGDLHPPTSQSTPRDRR